MKLTPPIPSIAGFGMTAGLQNNPCASPAGLGAPASTGGTSPDFTNINWRTLRLVSSEKTRISAISRFSFAKKYFSAPGFLRINASPYHLDSDYAVFLEREVSRKSLGRTVRGFGGRLLEERFDGDCLKYALAKLGDDSGARSFMDLIKKLAPIRTQNASKGDIVVYISDDTEIVLRHKYGTHEGNMIGRETDSSYLEINGKIYLPRHIGIVTGVENGRIFVISKWMHGPVIEAAIDVNLDVWGEDAVLFKRPETKGSIV